MLSIDNMKKIKSYLPLFFQPSMEYIHFIYSEIFTMNMFIFNKKRISSQDLWPVD